MNNRFSLGALALGTVLIGTVAFSGMSFAQDPGPQDPMPPRGGGGFGQAPRGQGFPGPFMMGGAPIMIDDAAYLYVMRGNTIYKVSKDDMEIEGETELPRPMRDMPPPPAGAPGPGGDRIRGGGPGGPGGAGGGGFGGRGGGEEGPGEFGAGGGGN